MTWACIRTSVAGILLFATSAATGADLPAPPSATPPAQPVVVAELPPPVKPVELVSLHPLTTFGSGRNDSAPVWSPTGDFLSFERSSGNQREILIAWADGRPVQTVTFQEAAGKDELQLFLPGVMDEVSYNSGLTWNPSGDRFVFMSNGGEGNYDLYLGEVGSSKRERLTTHRTMDGHAHWSPTGDRLLFVSGRSEGGDIYLLDLASKSQTRLTFGGRSHLYPQWSPDGKRLAFMAGSNENHDIFVIDDLARPRESLRRLTSWNSDDLRPVWSPDGKYLAFYTNHNPAGDARLWSIAVVPANGNATDDASIRIVANDVITDMERGPAWLPTGHRLVFVRNDKQEFNPLFLVDLAGGGERPIPTETKMNHDVSCAADGRLAFRAQVNQWDQIFVAVIGN
ncbi:MAG TPA: hypothetical protein VFR01_06235 [Geobacterales bacterium]|nr:hypothetical protein [Geobacterales bacterium]